MRARLSDQVVQRSFGHETVLLNLETGQYHGLRGSGGRMLEILADTGDLDMCAEQIAAEFDHPLPDVRRDLEELCRALAERRLVVIDDESEPG
jgi:hypothetical protein